MVNTTVFHQSIHRSSHNDEYLTPPEAVRIVLPYVQGKRIWCPFDEASSAFVQVLEAAGLTVLHSTLSEGQDFFQYVPGAPFDCIVSNPPYSIRNQVFAWLFELKKPFMMLVNGSGIFDNRARFDLFREHGVELLVYKGRTAFIRKSDGKSQSPMFQSLYLCHDMLPERLVFAADAPTAHA